DILIDFLNNHKKAAIVAPLLYNKNNDPYQLQGVKELTPFRAIVVFSFLNKLFPKNKVFQNYYLRDWDKKTTKEVDVIPGTAFMIRKNIFDKIGGFDEKFFLYFEEFDLCKRVKALGWKIFIYPQAKVFHAWGSSTRHRTDIKRIFLKSRFYHFKKHFGILPALFTEAFLRVNKYTFLLLLILIIGVFLRTYRIYETMPFIGDQAWFYLSARDMLLTGKIPLVGIESSHPWLHQGAFWTYILGLGFLGFGLSPYTGMYISIFLNILTILFMYKLGSLMFSQRLGIISSLLYAASPIVILSARMPYHTSPIPLLTLFYLWALYKWVKGYPKYFPVVILSLALLYNFEIAAFPLAIVFLIILFFGFCGKKKWAGAILTKKIGFYSTAAFLVPMLPMLIYDFGHGFPQTLRLLAWIGYKILVFFGYPPFHPEIASPNFTQMGYFIAGFTNRLIFLPNTYFAIILMVLSLGFFYKTLFDQFTAKKHKTSFVLLGLVFIISLAGIIATKTTSEAYLPILFPTSIFIIAIFFDKLLQKKYVLTSFILLLIIVIMNAYSVMMQEKGQSFYDRLAAAKKIVSQAQGRRYNLIGRGEGSQFSSFTMNYEYLTWWLGHAPSKEQTDLQFIISEDKKGIKVKILLLP
ncbi:glycosyltransferase family 39 protein, partial [Patescibacteria group bacterium]|nr:glycosyltransferase family 39 protein [Patescibacteria group bacterium]